MKRLVLVTALLILLLNGCCRITSWQTLTQQTVEIIKEVKRKTEAVVIMEKTGLTPVVYSTGFFIEYKGIRYYVTAAHTFYEAIKKGFKADDLVAKLTFHNTPIYTNLFLITPENNAIDILVFKLNPKTGKIPTFLISEKFKKEELLHSGEEVIFCGFPDTFKYKNKDSKSKMAFTYITRKCIVAAPIALSPESNDFRKVYMIDALADPGDSGSPLVNLANGELVGFVKGYKYSKSDPKRELGLGIAIPIKYVLELIDIKEKQLAEDFKK
jgi:hypothetical protein